MRSNTIVALNPLITFLMPNFGEKLKLI